MKNMRTKLFFLMILLVTTVCVVNAQDKKVRGTWKLVNEQHLAAGFTQIKSITATQFVMVAYGPDGSILGGGSGTQTAKGGKYTENIVSIGNSNLMGGRAVYTYTVKGKKMTIKGFIEKGGVKLMYVDEVWEKLD